MTDMDLPCADLQSWGVHTAPCRGNAVPQGALRLAMLKFLAPVPTSWRVESPWR
jgi:hypothetical protein